MKKIEIDGNKIITYEDGSIRIAVSDKQLCLDSTDIALLYEQSKKALTKKDIDCEDYCGEDNRHFAVSSIGNVNKFQ